MAEFISSFTTGFDKVIALNLGKILRGARLLEVYDGLVRYEYPGNPAAISRVPFFNNTFHILKYFSGNRLSFTRMVAEVSPLKMSYLKNEGSFRIRFSRSNNFEKVESGLTHRAEQQVQRGSRLRSDRVNPSTEFWYVIRSEGFGFHGQLLFKRKVTEKNLKKGELRPEFSYLLCLCAGLSKGDVIMDPFAGYGSIPLQIFHHFPFKKLIINDMDSSLLARLKKQGWAKDPRIQISCRNALEPQAGAEARVDRIITDPPWGFHEDIGDIPLFYEGMLKNFSSIIKKTGSLVLLSARKEELRGAIQNTQLFKIVEVLDTLVNGKKASVFMLRPKSQDTEQRGVPSRGVPIRYSKS